MQLSQTATLDFIRNRILLGTLSLSKNWHFHKKSSFSRKRESSVFEIVLVPLLQGDRVWIPRSSPSRISARSRIDRRMTNTEFLDRLCVPIYSLKGRPQPSPPAHSVTVSQSHHL